MRFLCRRNLFICEENEKILIKKKSHEKRISDGMWRQRIRKKFSCAKMQFYEFKCCCEWVIMKMRIRKSNCLSIVLLTCFHLLDLKRWDNSQEIRREKVFIKFRFAMCFSVVVKRVSRVDFNICIPDTSRRVAFESSQSHSCDDFFVVDAELGDKQWHQTDH